MRFLRVLVVVMLFGSVLMNVVLYRHTERLRPQLKINGTTITKKEYHDWLEQHYGTDMMAIIAKYTLVTQAAEKAGVKPAQADIEEQLRDLEELKPQTAQLMRAMPWKKKDVEQDIELVLALTNLSTKDVKASDDELKSFYNAAKNRWDHPSKLHTKLLQCADADTAAKAAVVVKQLIKPSGNGFSVPDMAQVAGQYAGKAQAAFGDGTLVLWRPFGRSTNDPLIEFAAGMKPGEVKSYQVPNANGMYYVIAMESIDPGHAGQFTEPDVRKRVERDYKLTRATPTQEILRGLWDSAKIEVDNEALKTSIERILLPERAGQAQQAALSP